jgi:hypothetical protein
MCRVIFFKNIFDKKPLFMKSKTNLYVLHKRRESCNGHEHEKSSGIHYYFASGL